MKEVNSKEHSAAYTMNRKDFSVNAQVQTIYGGRNKPESRTVDRTSSHGDQRTKRTSVTNVYLGGLDVKTLQGHPKLADKLPEIKKKKGEEGDLERMNTMGEGNALYKKSRLSRQSRGSV
mmetsp:Transcript_7892/g.12217  ORF Transcript_7892/g.12217 Transcript_7892/m.12217 type:complete len:120 (+) Transcript_7892:804-1163(+)